MLTIAIRSAICFLVLVAVPAAGQARGGRATETDGVSVSPDRFKVLLENPHVRVVEYALLPGERDQWHTHPPKVSYVVTGGTLRITTEDGQSFLTDERAGSASWMDTLASSHISATSRTTSMTPTQLTDFATGYAAAWSSQNPESLASFYAVNGSLTVNDGEPSVGRAAITATARSFMTAFPDMVVKMDRVGQEGSHAVFHWTWTGTNSGPGGTGKSVRISGYEEWTLGADGLIVESKGHFDDAEYQRQLRSVPPPVRYNGKVSS